MRGNDDGKLNRNLFAKSVFRSGAEVAINWPLQWFYAKKPKGRDLLERLYSFRWRGQQNACDVHPAPHPAFHWIIHQSFSLIFIHVMRLVRLRLVREKNEKNRTGKKMKETDEYGVEKWSKMKDGRGEFIEGSILQCLPYSPQKIWVHHRTLCANQLCILREMIEPCHRRNEEAEYDWGN